MSTKRIANIVGPPVEGDDFFGREKLLRYVWEHYILKGVSIRLSAPRRTGKSSFARKMLAIAEAEGWKILHLDLQGEQNFIECFIKEFESRTWGDKVAGVFRKLCDAIKIDGKVSVSSDVWSDDVYERITELIENAGELLIVIDEVTNFLENLRNQENGIEKVERFLGRLRKLRLAPGTQSRWIFCSSIGIENFTSIHRLSAHFNDTMPVEIGAFSEDEAKRFISCLHVDAEIQFTEGHIQYILGKLVWYLPFFIQLLVNKINFLVYDEDREFSNDIIDEAYNRLVIEDHFKTWDERLDKYRDFEVHARTILKSCALPNGETREHLFATLSARQSDAEQTEIILAKVLGMLQNDGYLVPHNGKYVFRSPLLRDFWYHRFIR